MQALVLIPLQFAGKFRKQDEIIESENPEDVAELEAYARRGIVRLLDSVVEPMKTSDIEPASKRRGYNTR